MRASRLIKARAISLAGTGLLALATPAFAQSSDQGAAQHDPGEIIVTASRRSELLIQAPQSVTALSAADLRKLNATQFSDFANTVPGLNFTTLGAGRTTINLRGVTTGIDVGPTVGIYVDDVPYGATGAQGKGAQLALDVGLFDLDRIEVLRGPQGTLYGASSVGGVLKYVTKAPSLTEFGGSAQAGVSTIHDGAINFNGAASVNVPIVTDKVAVRASGFYSRSGGYVDNNDTGQKDVDRSNVYGGRVDVLLKPVEDLTIRLTGFGQNIRRDGTLFSDYTIAGPLLSPYAVSGQPVNGSLEQNHPLAERFDSDFRLASGSISYDFGPASLTSVTSYQFIKNRSVTDASAIYVPTLQAFVFQLPQLAPLLGPVAAVDLPEVDTTKKFTQEVRLESNDNTSFQWLLGGFYTHEKSGAVQTTNAYDAALNTLPLVNIGALTVPSKYQEYAVFGDLTWHITPAFDVTGGVRYAHNNQDFEQIGSGLLIGSSPRQSSSESVVTYLANARYKFGNHLTAYARFATGYRPGGPNYLAISPTTGETLSTPTYRSDKLQSYEIGLKGETTDRTFGFDVSTYLIDWKNLQVATAVEGVSFIANAGNARIKGAELTLTARPVANFTATAAFAYNDGYLTKDDAGLGAMKDERLPNAPHVTTTVNVDYVLSESAAKPSLGATVRFVGDRTVSFNGSQGLPQYTLPSYVSVDLRAGATIGPVDAQVFVHNLFDVRGQLGANTAYSSAGGPARVAIMQPRTVGISMTTRF
jgi:outer membrane receptor protein involved in Fe transport